MSKKRPPKPKGLKSWEKPIPWDWKFKFEEYITFKGDTFMDWVPTALPSFPAKPGKRVRLDEKWEAYYRRMDLYRWANRFDGYAYAFLMSAEMIDNAWSWERNGLDTVRGAQKGVAYFDRPVYIPVLLENGKAMMSLTPNEILTQRAGLRKAKGDVLIGGLGIGWFARFCADRKQVKSVTVVERDQTIIDHFGKNLPDKVTVIHDDAFGYAYRKGHKFTRILFDTWRTYGRANWDRSWREIKDKCGWDKCWGWGDVETLPN